MRIRRDRRRRHGRSSTSPSTPILNAGFASRIITKKKRNTTLVWVYRRNDEPRECSTVDVGVESNFYKQGELNVDDEITELEQGFAACLAELRAYADVQSVTDDRFLQFVVNLTARTKHVRDSIISSTGPLIQNVFTYLSDYENWRDYCFRYFTRHPEIIREELEKALRNVKASAHKKAMARQKIKKMPVELILRSMDNESTGYEFLFQSLRIKLEIELNDIVKQAHIKSLLKNLVSEPRVDHYRELNWYVRKTSEPLILGDVCCVFELNSGFKSLGGTEDTIKNVYVPIASNCIVVGTPSEDIPKVDVLTVNELSAKLSRKYFIASSRSVEMDYLSTLLGTESEILSKDEMEAIVTDLLE